ncbi:MAG: CpaF family protein, partial [Limimaricola sp.]
MFSKFRKPEPGKTGAPAPAAPRPASTAAAVPAAAAPPALPGPAATAKRRAVPGETPRRAAEAAPADKERRRKERLAEIKLEVHKALLDTLNLAALEKASEQELRNEINAIAGETLETMGLALNREERSALNQDLYFEVTGLGPLETLLKDD